MKVRLRREEVCETNMFIERGGKEELLVEHVEVIEVKNGRLRVINIFGEEKEIKGAFKRFSLRENKIVFQAT